MNMCLFHQHNDLPRSLAPWTIKSERKQQGKAFAGEFEGISNQLKMLTVCARKKIICGTRLQNDDSKIELRKIL